MLGSVNRIALGRNLKPAIATHLALGLVGGVMAVMVARYLVGQIGVRPGETYFLLTSAGILVFASLRDLGIVRFPSLSTGVQVPKDWRHSMPTFVWVGLFGWILGFTFLTRTESLVVTACLVIAAAGFASILPTILFGAVYGVARVSIVLKSDTKWPETRRAQAIVPSAALLAALWLAV